MKLIFSFFAVILFASVSMAATSCADLKQELQAMQKAQQQIMASLVNNHETFASSLEEYSSAVGEAKGTSVKVVSQRMNNSAQAFRSRGIQGQKMTTQLNAATGDLLARVASCLK